MIDQVKMRLEALNVRDLSVGFFNTFEDAPNRLRMFLLELIEDLRKRYRDNLKEAIDGVNFLVQNYEENQVNEIQLQAAKRLIVWRTANHEIGPFSKHLKDSLLSAIDSAHPSSLRASVRRQGEWYNLDYSHHLGYGTRVVAADAVRSKLEKIQGGR